MSRIDEALRQAGLKQQVDPPTETATLESFPTGSEMPSSDEPAGHLHSSPQPRHAVRPPVKPPRSEPPRSEAPGEPAQDRRTPRFAAIEKLVVHDTTTPGCIEQYRRVAATLHHLQEERGLKVIMVASAQVGEGKTLTAANLALTLSESYRRRVLLIDADLRRPSLTTLFRLRRMSGLSESLHADDNGALRVLALSPSLSLLPSGRPSLDPMAGLTSGRMQQILAQAASTYDWVILDTPPVALQPDAGLLAPMVEGIVLVIGAGLSQCPNIQNAIETLGRDRIVGAVLNRVDPAAFNETAYYDYYAHQVEISIDRHATGREDRARNTQ